MGTTVKFDVFANRELMDNAYEMALYEKLVLDTLNENGYTLETDDRLRYNAILTAIGELDNAIYAANYSADQNHDVDVHLSIPALRSFHEFAGVDEVTINTRYTDRFGLDVGTLLDDLRSVTSEDTPSVH